MQSFGRDKAIYAYFFIAVVVYNFFLCFYAVSCYPVIVSLTQFCHSFIHLCQQLKFQNIVEVYMFMVINILAMGYAGLQVFQFRGFGEMCEPITNVGYLALANVSTLKDILWLTLQLWYK